MWCVELLEVKAGSDWVLQPPPHAAGQSHTGPCFGIAPTETVLLELLQCGSFPWPAASHELQHHWVLPTGSIFQEQAASDRPAPDLLQCGLLFPLGHRFCQEPVPMQTGQYGLLGAPTCSAAGVLQGLRLHWCLLPLDSSTVTILLAAAPAWAPASPGTW